MTNEEANQILFAPEIIDLDKKHIDRWLKIQAKINAQMTCVNNTKKEKQQLRKIIKRIDNYIKDIDPFFFDTIKQAED